MAEKPSVVDFPPEIVSEIFIHCLPWMSTLQTEFDDPFQNTQPQIVFDLRNAPLLLMHVCRRWRLIAEATPTLWTRPPNTWSKKTRTLELFKMYIKNSGEAPLWTHLVSGEGRQEIADVLTAQSHRWEHLTLYFGPFMNQSKISNLPSQLPLLKHLHLRQAFPTVVTDSDIYRLPKFTAPLLRSARIVSSKVLKLHLPWSQLTHYSGQFDCLWDAWEFLSLCTNLEVLHLHHTNQSLDGSEAVPSPIHLPRLHELLLINASIHPNNYHRLMNGLVLPVLETVSISIEHGLPILKALCRCVARSSLDGVPRLRSAEVRSSRTLGQSDLKELSLVAPGIRKLRISRPSSNVLFAMRFHPTDPFLFPCLEHLTLISPLAEGYWLVGVIMSRCYPPPSDSDIRLRHVEVMFGGAEEYSLSTILMSRLGMLQPLHQEFQDVAECFTDDPNFKLMCEALKSILTVRKISPNSQKYQLPSHWGRSMDPLQCFFEFSDAVFTFLENYEIYHPLLLSRHPAAPLLWGFLRGDLGSGGLLNTHRPEFLDRAEALLDEWQPIIDEYEEEERWVIETIDTTYPFVRQAEKCRHKVVYRTWD